MSSIESLEPVSVLPDRLAIAEFSRAEKRTILGPHKLEREMAAASFNWVAAYLCEEIGFYEEEIVDWFRAEARGLYGESPLSIWATDEGPLTVFEYAQECKEAVDEDMADEPAEHWRTRSHRLGSNAMEVVRRGFEVAGINLGPIIGREEELDSYAIHNPDKGDGLTARWKGNRHMEDYRITLRNGSRVSTYFVVRCFPEGSEPFILQTGVGHSFQEGEARSHEVDTDLDGRPPSIGDVASFVIPLATEVRGGTLALIG